jgi:hypothetical protein
METNREHFSWSQYELWHRSKREYWKRYSLESVVGEKDNKFYKKGKEFAKALETGYVPEGSDDPFLPLVVSDVPRLDHSEVRFEFNVDVDGKKKLCIGYIDSATEDLGEMIEYKTGKEPWTDNRVEEHDQLLFYALAFYKYHGWEITKKQPPNMFLVWIETMDVEGKLLYTGDYKIWQRKITLQDILSFEKKLIKTIREIDNFEYVQTDADPDLVSRYAHLLIVQSEIQDEMSEIKFKVQAEMENNNSTFANGIEGNFITSERKTWKYSEFVDELKKDLKAQQVREQKDGTATFKSQKSIMFKLNK